MADEPLGSPESIVAAAPVKKKLAERPEQGFERRRKLFFVSLVLLACSVGAFVVKSCSSPVNVAPMFGGSSAQAPAQSIVLGGPTALPLRAVAPPPAIPQVVMPVATPTVGLINGALTCWAIADFQTHEGLVPAEAQLRVYGYTNAKGGLVLVGTDWISTGLVRCSGDVTQLERPFVVAATPTREPRAPAPVIVVATPGPSIVLPTATPVNGLWSSGVNCWTINVEGVSQIWVNGKGASVGTYCGVTDLHIVMGGQ